jgi:DNA-binding MarR family transcriptional regulator
MSNVPSSPLAAAIKQRKPFQGPEHEVFVAIQRAASELALGVSELLKPAGLSASQYNVLRILRGAGKGGLSCGDIGDRLVSRDPDITRLLDRMEDQGLVSRARDEADRRIVTTRITAAGLASLQGLDDRVAEVHRKQLGHLGAARLRQLNSLLQAVIKPVDHSP